MKKVCLKAIDFFCGAGGMSFGMLQAGIRILAGIDIVSEFKETYLANIPNAKFINADITKLKTEFLQENIGISVNDNNLIFIGCSPCQYWSKINTDRNKSIRSKNLLNDFKRFVTFFKPGFVVIENVPGIQRKKHESGLVSFLNTLRRNGYKIVYDVIKTENYGVPQRRERFLLIAAKTKKEIRLPEPENRLPVVRDFIGEQNGFPKIIAGHRDKTGFLHTAADLSANNLKRIKKTPHDGGNRCSWKDDPKLQINAYIGKDHMFRDVYGRMYWNRPAPTITTRFNSISNGRFGHPEENRAISIREGATLQTFPKTYIFKGSNDASITKQIGNAVPPELSKRIAEAITRSLN